jgi:uncharacterized protein (TIGR03067 family)
MTVTGKWKIENAELGGKKLPVDAFANIILELDETSYQLWDQEVIDSGLIEFIDRSNPKALLITGVFGPNAGKNFGCIYRFDGNDKMFMCYNLGGETLPAGFETKENTLLYLVNYKRI